MIIDYTLLNQSLDTQTQIVSLVWSYTIDNKIYTYTGSEQDLITYLVNQYKN